MPMNRARYPQDWNEIAHRVKVRANWTCQHCGARHGEYVERKGRTIKVVLTVHHIGAPKADGRAGDPDDKMDCRPENLVALCAACHLNADRPHNLKLIKRNRRLRQLSAGQMTLWRE